MKLAIVLLVIVAFADVWNESVAITDYTTLEKQRFLYEIVYRIEDPLLFNEWIKLGGRFLHDKYYYTQYDTHMEKFWQSYKLGMLLPQGEFYGALVKSHHAEVRGLFNFFYFAKHWNTFVRNVCWARMHLNEGMFVHALTLAVIQRKDCVGLKLPAIYEIFPQNFFTSKLVFSAEKFNSDVWSKFHSYDNEYHGVGHREIKKEQGNIYHANNSKKWHWWNVMALGKHWLGTDKIFRRENIKQIFNTSDLINNTKIWYRPVDYTRDIEIFNEHTKLSYFTEDVEWNAYWYYLNMDYAFSIDGKSFGLTKDRRGEYWLYTVQQILARYFLERLSNGLGNIPQFSWTHCVKHGYDPHFIAYNGIAFARRQINWEVKSARDSKFIAQIQSFERRIWNIIDIGFCQSANGTVMDIHKPESIEFISNCMQGDMDQPGEHSLNNWYMLTHMYFSNVDRNDHEILPNVFLNYETMMRDPLFYILHKRITDAYYHFQHHLQPYAREELLLHGIRIKEVNIDKLMTYFDLVDFDVTNLLNDKMTFHDNEFIWDKALLARQARLNHKPFSIEYIIESDRSQKVVIRAFLAPKNDEYGRIIRLKDNRANFYKLVEFTYILERGKNIIKHSDHEFFWTTEDRLTYTELYKSVMLALSRKYELPMSYGGGRHCSFPRRLLLPHGRASGMPMQMFFIVTEFDADWKQASNFDATFSCGTRHLDKKSFGFPFDREINEFNFLVPNVFIKEVQIFHETRVQTN